MRDAAEGEGRTVPDVGPERGPRAAQAREELIARMRRWHGIAVRLVILASITVISVVIFRVYLAASR